jgi:glycosyltransferase involved in cell wall biosynthesis
MWMVELCASLRADGYDVVALIGSTDGGTAAALRRAGVPFAAISPYAAPPRWVELGTSLFRRHPFGHPFARALRRAHLAKGVVRMAWYLRRNRIDIVHGQVIQSIIAARIAAWIARVPIRVSMVPGPYHLEVPKARKADLRTQWIDTVTVGGSARIDELYAEAGIDPRKRRVIRYGADPDVFDPARANRDVFRDELGVAPGQPLVGQVAYFYAPAPEGWAPPSVGVRGVKGHEDFLRAARIVRRHRADVRFAVVGAGFGAAGEVYRQSVIRYAHDLELDDVLTFVSHRDDIPNVLAALDVSVQCSLNENYGGTIESLMMQRPTIATRVGAMPEAVRHEETGLLVPPSDPEALAAATLRLIDDPELAARLGRAGRELMLERFTTQRMCSDVRALYEELLRSELPGKPIPVPA